MKIAAAYIRVSTDEQTELSPASQKEEIIRYAKQHDYIVPDEYVFVEGGGTRGISGKQTKNRPEFQRMIAMAKLKPRPFDAILVWKFSRFARNTDESTYYKSVLRKKCGVDVVSISEPIENGMYGRLVEMIIEWSDEFYSYNLAGEVRRGMTEKARRGSFVSYAPIGYLMKDKQLIPDPATASAVQKVFSDFCAGISISDITRELNNTGLRTKFGNPFDHRSVIRMLNNPLYHGMIVWSKNGKRRQLGFDEKDENIVVAKGTHTPLVNDDVWEKTQKRLEENRIAYPKHAKSEIADEYMFRGLVKCHTCGGTMVRSNGGMQCNNFSKQRCTVSHYVEMKKLIDITMKAMYEDAAGDVEDMQFDDPPELTETGENARDDVEKKLERERQKLERVRAAYEAGVYTLEEFSVSKRTLLEGIARLEKQQKAENRAQMKMRSVPAFKKKLLGVLEALKNSDPPEQNRLLRTVITRIVFVRSTPTSDDHVQIHYHF